MKVVKPIFTIGIPSEEGLQNEVLDALTKKLDDYHVLFYNTYKEEFQFECFFEKDFNHVKFEELKQIVKDAAQGVNEVPK